MNKHPSCRARRSWNPGLTLAAAGMLGALCAACSAAGTEPQAKLTAGISGGTADGRHENVFLLVSHQDGSGSLCTATLIAPNLLLTARHCVSPGSGDQVLCGESVLGEPYPAKAFFATNAESPSDASLFFRVAKVQVPGQGEDTCGYDVALVILDQLVPASVAEAAVPRIDEEVVPGEKYTAVGYGEDETGASAGGRMRRDGLVVACEPGNCGAGVESTEFRGEAGICSGDSGGPALDADGKVVGVVSRGGQDCGTPVYGTVTAWRGFLIDVAKDAAAFGGYEPPFWVTTGMSDPPPSLSGEGGASAAPVGIEGEGDACGASVTCGGGLVCYSETGTADDAACARTCSVTSDCSSGEICENLGAASACVRSKGSADDSGCSMLRPGARGGSGVWSIVLLGLAVVFLRGRRAVLGVTARA